MQLPKYEDMLKLDKEKMQETMAPLRATEMKKKAELELAKIDSAIAEQEQRVRESAAKYPVNFTDVLETMDDLELAQRRKKQFTKIITEMFGA